MAYLHINHKHEIAPLTKIIFLKILESSTQANPIRFSNLLFATHYRNIFVKRNTSIKSLLLIRN